MTIGEAVADIIVGRCAQLGIDDTRAVTNVVACVLAAVAPDFDDLAEFDGTPVRVVLAAARERDIAARHLRSVGGGGAS